MDLTPKQLVIANELIKSYEFCSVETQKALRENGFFERVNVEHYLAYSEKDIIVDSYSTVFDPSDFFNCHYYSIEMPQFHEVWGILPDKLKINGEDSIKIIDNHLIGYRGTESGEINVLVNLGKITITEAASKLWLLLKDKLLITL